jgi:DNA-binding CsgD family transcriptional regulator
VAANTDRRDATSGRVVTVTTRAQHRSSPVRFHPRNRSGFPEMVRSSAPTTRRLVGERLGGTSSGMPDKLSTSRHAFADTEDRHVTLVICRQHARPFPPVRSILIHTRVVGTCTNWSAPVAADVAYRRAAGRRAINARRRYAAAKRQAEVVRLVGERGMGCGAQAEIARQLQVHRSTVCRDLRQVFGHMEPESTRRKS